MTNFERLNNINVNEHTEEKNGLTYLSWAWAWAEVKKNFTDVRYNIKRFGENQLPYVYDENTGYMVFTEVTLEGLTYEMWLPVMDSANKAMKNHPYTYDTRYKKGLVVEAATMFDINKTIMRCLVKNLAMFGLGLYIYAGEDLPETAQDINSKKEELKKEIALIAIKLNKQKLDVLNHITAKWGDVTEMNPEELTKVIEYTKNIKEV